MFSLVLFHVFSHLLERGRDKFWVRMLNKGELLAFCYDLTEQICSIGCTTVSLSSKATGLLFKFSFLYLN